MTAVTDLLVTFGPFDLSGDANMAESTNPVDIVTYFCAPPVGTTGQLPVPYRVAVGEDFTLTGSGYCKDGSPSTSTLFTNRTLYQRNDAVVGVSDARGVGEQIVFTRGCRAEYSRSAQVGQAIQYNFTAKNSGAIWSGKQGAYEDVAASGNGAGFEFGAVGAAQTLTLAQVAERLTGTGTLVTTWRTATAGTFVGETTRATFASIGATGEEVIQVAGAITDTWGRPVYAVTGTGSWRIRIYVSIE